MSTPPRIAAAALMASLALAPAALGHGDVAPQPVNTDALPDVGTAAGEDWLIENPYRSMGPEVYMAAIDVGASGYNQNCARCHGLGAVSGGLAPDLRYLEAEEYGDEWYMERYIHGYTQGGVTRMPGFGELLGEKAAWAIRSYVETRPDDESMAAVEGDLRAIRDELAAAAEGGPLDEAATLARLEEIAAGIGTLSGAELADSVASRAAMSLDGTPESFARAAETLTVGLSAAR